LSDGGDHSIITLCTKYISPEQDVKKPEWLSVLQKNEQAEA
jgi:hypothetical protein